MTPEASLNRLQGVSRAMAKVTTAGILFIAGAMALVFFIPGWTRNFLLTRLGQDGADLLLTPGHLVAAAAVTAILVGIMLYGLRQARAPFADFAAAILA